MALSGISPLTYSICNTIKRVVVILAGIAVFRNPIPPINAAASAIAIAGTWFYERAARAVCGLPGILNFPCDVMPSHCLSKSRQIPPRSGGGKKEGLNTMTMTSASSTHELDTHKPAHMMARMRYTVVQNRWL